MNIKITIIIIGFIAGIIFCMTYNNKDLYEGFSNIENENCPNILLREGEKIKLLNTKQPRIPGINPIEFNNLDEYAEYYEFQKKNNINCPVLYFQETYDTQDKKGWRLLMNPFDPQGGMSSHPKDYTDIPKVQLTDANDDRPPYNQNQYASFDPQDQYIGVKTPLDEKEFPEDPMSSDWKGHEYTHNTLMSGKFKDRTRDPNAEDRFAVK
tara:strand:+ start:2608 stop:3237 length:630 start_codon:yes stop_codon:yes gene_type:complete